MRSVENTGVLANVVESHFINRQIEPSPFDVPLGCLIPRIAFSIFAVDLTRYSTGVENPKRVYEQCCRVNRFTANRCIGSPFEDLKAFTNCFSALDLLHQPLALKMFCRLRRSVELDPQVYIPLWECVTCFNSSVIDETLWL